MTASEALDSQDLHPHSPIIDALGGPQSLADQISAETPDTVRQPMVSNWRRRGIPWRYRTVIARIAAKRGRLDVIPPDFVL